MPSHALDDLADILQLWTWAGAETDVTLILQGELSAETLAHLRHLLERLAQRDDLHVLAPLLRELHLHTTEEKRDA
jgi:glycine cleavage system regulatory protein